MMVVVGKGTRVLDKRVRADKSCGVERFERYVTTYGVSGLNGDKCELVC